MLIWDHNQKGFRSGIVSACYKLSSARKIKNTVYRASIIQFTVNFIAYKMHQYDFEYQLSD